MDNNLLSGKPSDTYVHFLQDIKERIPGRNGFSVQKLQPPVREISWSKNLLIMIPAVASMGEW